jgi:tetratricopeptide (TPR) repeat protein
MRHGLFSIATLSALLLLAVPSVAQDPSGLERAKASFRAGANAYAAGDYLAAIQALESAYALSPLPAIAFSLAQAERKQYFVDQNPAHVQRALALFRVYLEQEPRGARREDAQLALLQLEPLLGAKPVVSPAAPPAEARPTRLMIVADAPGARIILDGGPASTSPLIREVTPGKHRAQVRASGYVDAERDTVAIAGELILTEVRLKELPSVLYVWAPAAAEVYVDGVYVGQGGGLVTVPLIAGPHQLSVAQKGRRLVRRDLVLKRGESHTEEVTLSPTTQRTVSNLLFIGGGAAFGAGLALSAMAVRSENDAEDFLREQGRRNVSTGELVAYNARLVERWRWRAASASSSRGCSCVSSINRARPPRRVAICRRPSATA